MELDDIEAILRKKLLELGHYAADRYTPIQLTNAVKGLVKEVVNPQGRTMEEAYDIAMAHVLGVLGLSYEDWHTWTS